MATEREEMPTRVGLCPDPNHMHEFYLPLEDGESIRCPLGCDHDLVIFERAEVAQRTPEPEAPSAEDLPASPVPVVGGEGAHPMSEMKPGAVNLRCRACLRETTTTGKPCAKHSVGGETRETTEDACGVCGGRYAGEVCGCLMVLERFHERMVAELVANAGKGGRDAWRNDPYRSLVGEVLYHAAKLSYAARQYEQGDGPLDPVREFAADTANMAMMVADSLGAFDAPQRTPAALPLSPDEPLSGSVGGEDTTREGDEQFAAALAFCRAFGTSETYGGGRAARLCVPEVYLMERDGWKGEDAAWRGLADALVGVMAGRGKGAPGVAPSTTREAREAVRAQAATNWTRDAGSVDAPPPSPAAEPLSPDVRDSSVSTRVVTGGETT